MRSTIRINLVLCAVAACCGCASITSQDDFLRGGASFAEFQQEPPGLIHLSSQLLGQTPSRSAPSTGVLETDSGAITVNYQHEANFSAIRGMALERDPVLIKLTEALKPGAASPRKVSISVWELKDFARKLVHGLGSYDSDEQMLAEVNQTLAEDASLDLDRHISGFSTGVTISLKTVLAAYLKDYLSGKFVDRAGNELAKPKISKTIGNDTITGFETVILEAIFDFVYLTPALYTEGDMEYNETYVGPLNEDVGVVVTPASGAASPYKVKIDGRDRYFVQLYKEKGKPKIYNKEKKQPTFVKVFPKLIAQLSTSSQKGVTALERETIDFVCSLSSQGSQQLSGLITRLFGGIHLGFGILGKISIGDNDTVAKAVETFAEVSSRRYLEAKGYDTFNRFVYTEKMRGTKIVDVVLTEDDKNTNEGRGIDRKKGDALILILRVQLKLHGLLG